MNLCTRFFWLLGLLSLIQVQAWAQSYDPFADSRSDSTTAYWLLRAAPADQTPTVQFYNAHHQLLYQEVLPAGASQVHRPTKQTLNRFLADLTSHRLPTMTYLSQPLRSLPMDLSAEPTIPSYALRQTIVRKGKTVSWVEPKIEPSSALLVTCAQQSNKLGFISLEDSDRNELFEKRFKARLYTCKLNLVTLPSGQYRLKAGTQSHPVLYELLIDQASQQILIRPEGKPKNL
ncbi:hypothetical protein [Spirosoma linguale]